MRPSEYLEHLRSYGDDEHLPLSDLRTASEVEVESAERETKLALPDEYVNFLCSVGAGDVYGGLGSWFHLDITRPGNILSHSQAIMQSQLQEMKKCGIPLRRWPKGFLIIYDSHDGTYYGLLPNASSGSYRPDVFCWDTEEHEISKVADSFYLFLDYLVQADEIEKDV